MVHPKLLCMNMLSDSDASSLQSTMEGLEATPCLFHILASPSAYPSDGTV